MIAKLRFLRGARALLACAMVMAALGAFGSSESIAAFAKSLMLPAGYLSTRGNQIVDAKGMPVRIACVGGFGTDIVGGRMDYRNGPYQTLDQNIAAVQNMGFNCIRADYGDKVLEEPGFRAQLDDLVAACTKYGVKVIIDNHANEPTPANWANVAQQSNGLWFDKGPGTDGTDGGGDIGTITDAKFLQNWVFVAKRYAGNPTVIGFDLRNEPCAHTSTPALWGGGGPTDIHAMYERVGNAIDAVNPGALIICESVINYKVDSYEGDFAHPEWIPIVLKNSHKVVYSVHEYPKEVGGYPGPESGPGYIDRMNKTWGRLISKNVAPVWVGEMGGVSMTSSANIAWGDTLLSYMNGRAPGGIRFTKDQQPISGDWWRWGAVPDTGDGCFDATGKMNAAQAPYIDQLLYSPR